MLNHLPKKQVNNIVTPRVLDMDKKSCDHLLQQILKEKQDEDNRKS